MAKAAARAKTIDGVGIWLFRSKGEWAAWLDENHRRSAGVWVRIGKKGAELRTVSYLEALDVALCYGWIDGQKKPESEEAWLQKFAPRAERSVWSKINREKALGLIASGAMTAAGLAAIENGRKSGRWEAAYDSPRGAVVPEDLRAALAARPRAKAFFETLNKANRYAVLWRIQTVKKAETRARKIAQFVAMLEKGEKLHP